MRRCTSDLPGLGHVAIVGAGVAGLYVARALEAAGVPYYVFERHNRIGGRVLTLDNFECAASRLFDTHARAHALVRELGLHADDWPVETVFVGDVESPPRGAGAPPHLAPFDARALEEGPTAAAAADARTGYDDHTKHARGRANLGSRSTRITFVREGLSALVEGLAAGVNRARVKLQTRVRGVKRSDDGAGFRVLATSRDGAEASMVFGRVVLALPPSAAAEFRCIRDHGHPLASMLHTVPLHRIYGRVTGLPDDVRARLVNTRVVSDTPLRQTIGCPPLRGESRADWVQVSYTAGALARMWQREWTARGAGAVTLRMEPMLRGVLERAFRRPLPSLRLSDLESHYWEQAVHAWEPPAPGPASAPPGRPDRIAPELRRVVHRTRCPGLVWAGEAVSEDSHGWIEGALETAHDALAELGVAPFARRPPLSLPVWRTLRAARAKLSGRRLMAMDDRVLDVTDWVAAHPGGKCPIIKHDAEDVTPLWHMYHQSSAFAWRAVAALQVGWLAHNSVSTQA